MRILVTNDDGYLSEGIKLLIEKAKKYGEVVVVAPKQEQSAMSHAIKVRGGFKYKKLDLYPDIDVYYIDSTPADCVRYAYYGLKLDFDIVFSGVNKGFNIGDDILYSGTVSAVFEAGLLGKKAIAFSADKESFSGAENYLEKAMDFVFENDLLKHCDLYNINFPINPQGIKITKQGGCNFDTYFESDDEITIQLGRATFENDIKKIDLDTSCVMNNYISITPLTTDRTNIQVYEYFKNKKTN